VVVGDSLVEEDTLVEADIPVGTLVEDSLVEEDSLEHLAVVGDILVVGRLEVVHRRHWGYLVEEDNLVEGKQLVVVGEDTHLVAGGDIPVLGSCLDCLVVEDIQLEVVVHLQIHMKEEHHFHLEQEDNREAVEDCW